ncbi:hypothetical protein J3F83DRAFT_741364 [Trichoderma novae-zelandiae]
MIWWATPRRWPCLAWAGPCLDRGRASVRALQSLVWLSREPRRLMATYRAASLAASSLARARVTPHGPAMDIEGATGWRCCGVTYR